MSIIIIYEVKDCWSFTLGPSIYRFLRAQTDLTVKITLPGPFTMSQQVLNEAYNDEAALALGFAVLI